LADFNSFDSETLRQFGYLGAERMELAQKVGHQIIEISKFCKDGRHKLSGINIDTVLGIVFPVFSNDTLESIVDRYIKLYPTESKSMVNEFQLRIKDNETGFSRRKLMKLDCSIPARIKNACKHLDRNFWDVNNGANVDRFKALCPKLATKSKTRRIFKHD
jgi:hypothetical protein